MNVSIFITQVRNCVMGVTPMQMSLRFLQTYTVNKEFFARVLILRKLHYRESF